MLKFAARAFILFLLATSLTACELVGDIFQVGFAIGAIIVLLIVGIISWMARRSAMLRYKILDHIELYVRNRGAAPIDTVNVALDSTYTRQFSDVVGTPLFDEQFRIPLQGCCARHNRHARRARAPRRAGHRQPPPRARAARRDPGCDAPGWPVSYESGAVAILETDGRISIIARRRGGGHHPPPRKRSNV